MPRPIPRRFTLLDAMALIVALAIGLALARAWFVAIEGGVDEDEQIRPGLATFLLLPFAPTLVLLRLRRPRPRLQRLARQPGFQASLAACTATAYLAVRYGYCALLYWRDHINWYPAVFEVRGLAITAVSVIVAWVALAAHGIRAEAGWLDRTGRVLGGSWIAAWAILDVWPAWTFFTL
jgi:hypothetical protein